MSVSTLELQRCEAWTTSSTTEPLVFSIQKSFIYIIKANTYLSILCDSFVLLLLLPPDVAHQVELSNALTNFKDKHKIQNPK